MKKIVTVGSAAYDIFINYAPASEASVLIHGIPHRAFACGSKIEVESLLRSPGGGALNSAISFSRLGFSVTPIFKIGPDQAGQEILNLLKQEKISAEKTLIDQKESTGQSFILGSGSSQDRTVFFHRGANATWENSEFPWSILDGADALYLSSLAGKSAHLVPELVKRAHEKNLFIAINPGTRQLTEHADIVRNALEYIRVLILNEREAQLLHPFQNEADFFAEILKLGPSTVALTKGDRGVCVATQEKTICHPAIAPKILKNTVGAGDAFGSACIAMLLEGKSIEDALKAGILNSSSVLEHHNAHSGLLSRQHIEKLL